MAKKRRRSGTFEPVRYNKRSLHSEREYGFFWYAWLWRILRPILVFLCSLLIVTGFVSVAYQRINGMFFEPVEPGSTEKVPFTIESGTSVSDIAKDLVKANLLRNGTVFRYIVQFKGLTNAISYGTYELSPGMTAGEIIAELSSGSQTNERTITVIPGWTVEQTADYLVKEGAITDRGEFLRLCNEPERFLTYSYALSEAYSAGRLEGRTYALEGYLAPDTYRVFRSADAESILRTLLSQGNTVVDTVFYRDYTQYTVDEEGVYQEVEQYRSPLSMDEVIVLASLIEKEAGKTDQYPLVAAVFNNRLDKGMRLESDASVNYVTGRHRYVLSGEDLSTESGYNTYLADGLPVGPICCPSQSALMAALYPDETYIEEGYLYFCAREPETGELVFARTKEEHDANVALYRPSWEAYDALHAGD